MEWRDGRVIIDSGAGTSLLVTGRDRGRGSVIGPLKCPPGLHALIQVLCADRVGDGQRQGGLGLSYSELLSLLKQTCDSRLVDAEFRVGPLAR